MGKITNRLKYSEKTKLYSAELGNWVHAIYDPHTFKTRIKYTNGDESISVELLNDELCEDVKSAEISINNWINGFRKVKV